MNTNSNENIELSTENQIGIKGISPQEAIEHLNQYTEPVPIYNNSVNIFPVDAFSIPAQKIIAETRANLNYLPDYIGTAMLAAISTAIGNTFRIKIKNEFEQPAMIFAGLVGAPGSNKSEPLSWAFNPIVNHDARTFEVYERQIERYLQNENLSKKERKHLTAAELRRPVWNKYLLNDFTTEAIIHVHKGNPRGIGIVADELIGLIQRFNRYNSSGQTEFFLSTWSSKAITVDRKSEASTLIKTPHITIIGTIQPGTLGEFAKGGRMNNGFTHRFAFTDVDNAKKEPWTEASISPEVGKEWATIIERVLSLSCKFDSVGNPIPRILRFNAQAKGELFRWQKHNTQLCINAESESTAGAYSKLDLMVPRIALVLHVLLWASGGAQESPMEEVGLTAVEGAIKLAEYFRVSAVKVNAIIASYNPLDKLPADKRELYELLPETFSTGVGLAIATKLGTPSDTYHKWLARETGNLFKKLKKGEYQKML